MPVVTLRSNKAVAVSNAVAAAAAVAFLGLLSLPKPSEAAVGGGYRSMVNPGVPEGIPEDSDCLFRSLAWEYGKELLPERGDFRTLFDALQLHVSCPVCSSALMTPGSKPSTVSTRTCPRPRLLPSSHTFHHSQKALPCNLCHLRILHVLFVVP